MFATRHGYDVPVGCTSIAKLAYARVARVNGTEIRRARERRGLTQQQLAAAIGVGQRTIGNWERGETVPRSRMAMIEEFFAPEQDVADPIRSAPDVKLLAELLRRAAEREVPHVANGNGGL